MQFMGVATPAAKRALDWTKRPLAAVSRIRSSQPFHRETP
jgi:hypothetical protein